MTELEAKINELEKQKKQLLASLPVTVELGSYKGQPTISLHRGSGFPFSFGIQKAKMILESFEQIKSFVEKNS